MQKTVIQDAAAQLKQVFRLIQWWKFRHIGFIQKDDMSDTTHLMWIKTLQQKAFFTQHH